MSEIFKHEILCKYMVAYFKCDLCGFLCTEVPFWLSEAYETAITNQDTGLLSRNLDLSRKIAVLIYYMFKRDGNYLDYAGGYGVFTRLMRDAGFNFFHTDPYTQNLFAGEFEWDHILPMDGVTCFECFEHLVDPMQTIREISSISKTIFFATVLLPEAVPKLSWDYYGFEHGQHVSFYSTRSLQFIARKLSLNVVSVGNLHLFSAQPVNRRRMKALIHKSNRAPYLFSRKTIFETVAKQMRHQNKRLPR